MAKLALVTGISGFLGTSIALQLLERGYRVRGCVRNQSKAEAWERKHSKYASQLNWAIVPDMQLDGAYKDAVANGVDLVFHVASPFFFTFTDSEKEMLIPARRGVENMLEAASREPSIERVIFTSSFAAVTSPHLDPRPGHVYTEEDWNPSTYEEAKTTTDKHFVYLASKTFAEKAAWDFMERVRPAFALTTIVPPVILGRAEQPFESFADINQSSRVLWRNIDADKIPDTPAFVCVNVRDCALAHVLAAERDVAKGKRYLTVGSAFSQPSAARVIKSLYGGPGQVGHRITAPIPDEVDHYGFSSARAEQDLGMRWTSYEDTIKEAMDQLVAVHQA